MINSSTLIYVEYIRYWLPSVNTTYAFTVGANKKPVHQTWNTVILKEDERKKLTSTITFYNETKQYILLSIAGNKTTKFDVNSYLWALYFVETSFSPKT